MRKPSRPLSYLSMLPLPLLAGWFLAAQPPEPVAAPSAYRAGPISQFPAPQVDEAQPPAELPPTF
jgi:hypothetical protein